MHSAGAYDAMSNTATRSIAGALELLHLPATNDAATPRPPLLFVHGAWHGAWCWDAHFLPYFAAHGWDCTAVSLRGHGGSAGGYRFARLADYVEDVARAAASLSSPPILVGHSMGGFVVMKYLDWAGRHGYPRPPAAVFLAPIPTTGAIGFTTRGSLRDPVAAAQAILGWDGYPFFGTLAKAKYYCLSDAFPDAAAARLYARIGGESMTMLLDALFLTPLNLKRLRAYCSAAAGAPIPLLLMAAARDRVFTRREGEQSAAALGAAYRLMPGLAHDLMLDIGWETAADTLRAWLDEQQDPSPPNPLSIPKKGE